MEEVTAFSWSVGLLFALILFVRCLQQTPPFLAWWLLQSSKQQRLTVAPWLIQTPPTTVWLVHPLWLQRFFFAPCVTHTPSFCAWLAHPSKLQRLTVAPCVMHIPPLMAWLLHPLWLQRFTVRHWVTQSPLFCACFSSLKLHCLTLAPCVTHNPLLLNPLVHPATLHSIPLLLLLRIGFFYSVHLYHIHHCDWSFEICLEFFGNWYLFSFVLW